MKGWSSYFISSKFVNHEVPKGRISYYFKNKNKKKGL